MVCVSLRACPHFLHTPCLSPHGVSWSGHCLCIWEDLPPVSEPLVPGTGYLGCFHLCSPGPSLPPSSATPECRVLVSEPPLAWFFASLPPLFFPAGHCRSAQSYLTLCDPLDDSPPGSSVHGILQARILEWVDISFSRGASGPRDETCVSCTG